jgi:putative FmdB family regulatory protein
MANYSYKCKSCAHEFDVDQAMSAAALKVCPKCKGELFRKIGKNVGISFVGSGFYVNDNKASGATPKGSDS